MSPVGYNLALCTDCLELPPVAFKYERIDKNDAVLLVVDLQEGLYQIARDQSAVAMKNNILAHAALGKIFNLPSILTTSTETGKNMPICVFAGY